MWFADEFMFMLSDGLLETVGILFMFTILISYVKHKGSTFTQLRNLLCTNIDQSVSLNLQDYQNY